MSHEAGHSDEVKRPFPEDRVGDVDVARGARLTDLSRRGHEMQGYPAGGSSARGDEQQSITWSGAGFSLAIPSAASRLRGSASAARGFPPLHVRGDRRPIVCSRSEVGARLSGGRGIPRLLLSAQGGSSHGSAPRPQLAAKQDPLSAWLAGRVRIAFSEAALRVARAQ
jgi:hypothetical protein